MEDIELKIVTDSHGRETRDRVNYSEIDAVAKDIMQAAPRINRSGSLGSLHYL